MIKPQYDKNGKSVGSKLEQYHAVEKMSGIKVPELALPTIDLTIQYLLDEYWKIKTTKGVRLTYVEVSAYRNMMERNLSPVEVDALMSIDHIFERY